MKTMRTFSSFCKTLTLILILLATSVNAHAWGWVKYESTSPATIYPGDKVEIQMLLNGDANGASYKRFGYGTTNSKAGLTWSENYNWIENVGSDNRWKFNFTPTSATTYYWSLWIGWGSSVGDNGRYYKNGDWNEGSESYQSASVTVTAVPKVKAFTATAQSTSSIALSWTKNSLNDEVLIVQGSSTAPTQGTSYSNGSTIGTGKVVYKGSATSTTITGLSASTSYTFYIYSIHNSKYYSTSTSASATTETPTYSYTVTADAGGSVTPTSGTVAQGSGVTITATPNDGYEFDKWTATNGTLANANSASTTFTPSANNANATASFKLAGCTQTPTTPTSLTAKVGGSALAGAVCSGTNVTLTAGGSISVGSLQWGTGTVGENIIAEGNGRSSITVSPAATTTYWVRSIITEAGVCYGATSDAKTLQVSVTPALVQPVLSKSTLTLEEGGSTGSITVTSGTTGGTWTSSDTNVATVNNGTVTPKGPGTATITYTVSNGCEEDKTATCDVTVNAKPYYIAGRLQQNWNTSSTTQQFTYVSNGQYKYETGKTVAELSAQWQDNNYTANQYFFIHTGSGVSNSFTSSNSNGHNFHQKLGYENALTLSAYSKDEEANYIKFADANNNSSDVVIWWEPSTKKLWYTATANYTVTYSQTPTAAADAPTSPSVNSGNSVVAGTSVTFTAKDAKTGYAWKGWYDNSEGTGTALSTNKAYTRTINADTEIYAVYTANTYSVKFNNNGGTGEMANQDFTYDAAAQDLTANTFTRTGYTFAGWNTQADGKGTSYTNKQSVQNLTTDNNGVVTLYAQWTATEYNITYEELHGVTHSNPTTYTIESETITFAAPTSTRNGYTFAGWNPAKIEKGSTGDKTVTAQWTANTYTVTLDQEGAAEKGDASVSATYNADMPEIAQLPTAKEGYGFMGYWDGKDGAGTRYYDSIGASAHVWNKTEDATLYAYFKKAEITINLNAASFEPNSATPAIATATITPTPVGTTSICWELLYNDDTPVAEHDPQERGEPNQVQFNINDLATGTYQIKATLREGAGCEGTIISQATQVFTITSDHTITIKYVDENGQTIKASTTQSAHVSSLTEITAPPIIGYTFKEWEAGDGVSIKDATDGKKNTDTIEYNAYYDGYLKAIYTKNSNIIYFYNTLGWENVYVYFYNNGEYWNAQSGTGTKSSWYSSSYKGRAQMTRMDESNIWYVDATGNDTKFLVFGKDEQVNYDWFSDTEVIRRGDYNSSLPMFVPIADQTPTELNKYTNNEGKDCVTKYYNKGYWMNYPENTGYTLDLFNHYNDNNPARYFIYPYSQDTIFPLQIQVDINAENVVEGAKKIWFRIHRNDGKNFGGHANTFPRVNPTTTGGFIADNDYKVELITPIAGTYTFILDYKYDETAKDYKYHIEVDYPAKVGDYRILYRDEAETNWSGNTKPVGWYHPSRVIKKGEDRKDIISFYINKDVRRSLSYQTIETINNTTGVITWNTTEVPFSTIDWSQITKSGVYNFTFVQDSKGISVENDIVPYEGNYYIRTDSMGGGWEDYKTNSENRMTYSSFSESDANSFGEKFSHYAVKWCKAGTNVKFTIANDYSHCISDTLAQDIIPLGNLTDEGTLLNNDIYDANIRFMWNRKTNKISREYVGPAGDKQSQFLMLKACEEIQDAEGNKLNPAEGDILDEGNGIYAARFADTQNWIYERTIQVKPRTRVKLYACYPKVYHIYVQNKSNWDQVALYAWKDSDKPLGDWPGTQPYGTVEIGGKTYYDFHVNEYVFGCQLILNNNNKGQQTDGDNAFKLATAAGNYYLIENSKTLTTEKSEVFATESKARYFRGEYAEGSCDDEHTIQILGGEGETWNTIRVIYDFKTNRLMAAWMPNNNEIDTKRSIESDVMIIRDHQNAAQCITFANDSSKLTDVKTVYGVMRFNRWILNNRGGEKDLDANSCGGADSYDEKTTNQNHPVLDPAKQKSQYERALYFISFPFDVHLSDVFGFGTYGQHWIIEYYDGLKRAREGYWIDSDPNWKYVTNPTDFVLKAYEGYILCLNLGKMAYDNTDFWAHNISQVELFFPSVTTMEEISKIEVTMPSLGEEYLCKINRGDDTEGDRRVKDSYWRCIGVPSYANYSNVLKDEKGDPIKWQTSYKTFPFLYKWNMTDNTLTPQSTTNFKFETMHAYLVQNGGEIHWSAVSATPEPASIVARKEAPSNNYEWKITLTRNEQVEDQAFIRLSNDEKITNNFDFNQDLSKEFNYGRSDIYTLIGYEKAAANSLPISEQTTVIPLGLSIEYNGDYTLAMPDRVNGIGVTLVDNQTGTRTNLSAGMDYTLTLKKGDYNNRFFIEISPVQQVPTDIEYVTGDSNSQDNVRKVLIDNILYIVRDGQIFDARGVRVQ